MNNSGLGLNQSRDPGQLYWTGEFGDFVSPSAPLAPNETTNTGDSHSTTGNYYNTAALQATNDAYTSVDQSICPAGWALPRIGRGDDTFYQLFLSYGYTDSGRVGDTFDFNSSSTIFQNPLYLVPSGYLTTEGYSYSSSVATYASFGRTGGGAWIYESGAMTSFCAHSSDAGVSVRCVARPVTSTIDNSNFWCD